MDLKPLLTFLKIVSFLGLIVTIAMMTAVIYKKLKEHYPVQVEKNQWVFILVGGLMTFVMIFIYRKFILSY